MSAATSVDRNQESIGNTMGAPGVEAQQKLEQQPTSHSSSCGQKRFPKFVLNRERLKQRWQDQTGSTGLYAKKNG